MSNTRNVSAIKLSCFTLLMMAISACSGIGDHGIGDQSRHSASDLKPNKFNEVSGY